MLRHCVLGGAGFIGSHLCDALLARGDHVVAFDDMSTGRRENVMHLLDHERFHIVQGDVRMPKDLGWNGVHFLHGRFSRVWNLACPASPPVYQRDPVGTMMTCVMGTKNALDLAKKCGAVMVQASTSEVYGDPLEHPQRESYRGNVNTWGIRANYDEGKRAAETLCHDYLRHENVNVRVARIFNTYGERLDPSDGRVVSNFITQALTDHDITVYGSGSQTRSFCHVSDLVRGLIALADLPWNPGVPINLGNPGEFTVLELAKTIVRMSCSKSQIRFEPLPSDDPCRRRPDISLANEVLKWAPIVDLEEGLRMTIATWPRVQSATITSSGSHST